MMVFSLAGGRQLMFGGTVPRLGGRLLKAANPQSLRDIWPLRFRS